ncbi:MAG: MarR family transcriptional regulator [Bacilli bacterium]
MDIDTLPIYLDQIKKQMKKNNNVFLSSLSLTHIQAMHLMYLFQNKEGLTLNELTKMVDINKANTTRAIKDLIIKGYVTKENDKIRGFKIKLTDNGKNIAKRFYQKRHNNIKIMLTNFTNQEKKQMLLLMKKIVNNLNKEDEH